MSRPRLLDLFCGAGGCSAGYHRAGFEVVGVDIKLQPRYPFEFRCLDALDFLRALVRDGNLPWDRFDAIHASPPCQAHTQLRSVNQALGRTDEHVDLIASTRELLRATGLPYVIENVVGAPLLNPVRICGSSVGLPVLRRHRLFESNVVLLVPPCDHSHQTEKRFWTGWVKNGKRVKSTVVQVYGNGGQRHPEEWADAMGIDWMRREELAQAIPPAYTELIGHQLMQYLRVAA